MRRRSPTGTTTADVIVVGFGAAGSAAAFSAAAAGAQVLVTERTGGPGGAAALAEGIVYLGGGTPIQTACGFEDSLDDMYRYMMAACGPDPNEAKIARYCEESLGHFDWLVARGVPFDPTFCADTSMAPDGTEGLVYSGGEDAYPFNADRPAGAAWASGQDEALDGLAAHAAPGGCRHRCRRCRLDRHQGRPPGVRRRPGRRRAGAALRRDGDAAGQAWRRAHRGRLHLQRRHVAPALPPAGPGHLQGGHRGRRRAGHPHGAGHRRVRAQHVRRRGVAADHAATDPDPRHPRQRQGPALHQRGHLHGAGGPVRALRAGRRGLPDRRRSRLRGELDGPGRHLGLRDRGATRVRNRPARPVRSRARSSCTTGTRRRGRTRSSTRIRPGCVPLVPPIGAVDLRIGPAPYAPFTLGGLETTVAGEVCDLTGAPIGGLFAAGRTTSGVCSFGYASGLSIGDSTLFGRFAGQSAAAAPPSA